MKRPILNRLVLAPAVQGVEELAAGQGEQGRGPGTA